MTRAEAMIVDRRRLRRITEGGDAYLTRREWIIAEWIIGVVSCATAITGIAGGLVSETLARTASNSAWFMCFYLSGSAFIVLAFLESRCRSHRCGRSTLVRYAYLRFGVHAVNLFCWAMAFAWLHISGLNIASIYYQALPLAVANCYGLAEHAKALWLKPRLARTTSITLFGLRLLRGR
jgi:hypothetical protein